MSNRLTLIAFLRAKAGVEEELGRRLNASVEPTHRAVVRRMSERIPTELSPPPSPAGLAGGLAKWQVRRVTSYMLDHLDRHLTLSELASLVDLSRAHFCTAFRHSVGRAPRDWLIEKRIERARKLLAEPTMSITEIALALGYTPSAFGAIFRERVGMTPSGFRRAL